MTTSSAAAATATAGPVLFARYAYPPNRLGLCGPDDAPGLLDGAASGAERQLRSLALGFEGAYPYLRLIAEANDIADPLDARVVDAYWLGSPLTAAVRPRPLHRDLEDRFRQRMTTSDWRWLEAAVSSASRPVHAFHVLEVFPRVGLLRGGAADQIVETIDSCRIRPGRVLAVDGGRLMVAARSLVLVDGHLQLGDERTQCADAWRGGAGVLDGVVPGDWVSLHWGWACDRLNRRQLVRLVRWTEAAIRTANRSM